MRFMAESKTDRRFSRVCGVDPGLGCTGYGVVALCAGELRVVEAGVLRNGTSADPLAGRLVELADGLEAVLREHRPEAVAVEQVYAHYKHPRTAVLMGHARGVILMTSARHGLPVLDLPATTVKRYLTGSGHASKEQMQRMIAGLLGLARCPEPADVADALALALCALHRQGRAMADGGRIGGRRR
jgi:crossover junction endodeoxyribonuclease RuvC